MPMDLETPRVFIPLLGGHRFKGAYGGRGSGKSHFFAEMAIERCVQYPGQRIVCVREIQRSLKQSVKLLLEDKIAKMGLRHAFSITKEQIVTPGGGIITFQGMQSHTSETIKSLEGYDVALVEEAQSLSVRSLTMLTPTIRKDADADYPGSPSSELWFAWNPRSPSDPVEQLFRGKNPHPESICVEVNYEDNPWFPDALRADMEYDKRRDPDRYAHVWCGKYQKHSQARVFKNWRVGDAKEFNPGPRTRFYYGADWGYSIDPSVIVRMYIVDRNLYIDREAYQVGCEIDNLPRLFDKCDGGQARRWPIRADSSKPDVISYLKRNGYPNVVPSKKGAGSVEEGIEFLQSFDIVVHPECVHTIDELTNYSYKVDRITEEVLPILGDKDNHVIDSARYALEEVRSNSYTVMEYVS